MTGEQIGRICRFQNCGDVSQVRDILSDGQSTAGDVEKLEKLWKYLEAMGVADYCRLDMRIVRGLAYYTGIVYEIFDKSESLRAIAGGGRYDNLLEVLGGPKLGATGFGMGDVVLEILLEEKGKLPDLSQTLDFFVVRGNDVSVTRVVKIVAALRSMGYSADFSYKRQSIGKQLKEANRRGAVRAVIAGENTVAVKDLSTGIQEDRPLAEFLNNPLGS